MEAQRNSTGKADYRTGHGDAEARRTSRVWVPVVALAVVAIALASTLYSLNRPTIPDEIEGLIEYGEIPSEVVEGPVIYSVEPPVGGQHAPTSLECGLYFSPVENETAVAALATGAVWIAYNPERLSESELEDLRVFGEGKEDVFMTPYPNLPHPVIVTAWGVQLYPDSPTDPRIASFIRDFKNAESAPYPGLRCHEGEVVGDQ